MRIVVGEDLVFADHDTMAEVVAKVTSSYLETRWLWPRRYGLVAPFAFVLADPRVTLLDPRELQSLAAELHIKLFGQESPGDVTLLTLEGDQAEVMKFAGATRKDIQAMLDGEIEGIGGRVCKITRDSVESIVPENGPVEGVPPFEVLEPTASQPTGATFRGLYHLPREQFVGSVLLWRPDSQPLIRSGQLTLVEGAAEHDTLAVAAAQGVLDRMKTGRLLLTLSYSTLIKPSGRAAIGEALRSLSPESRPRLTASIYDTPRSPTFQALAQVRTLLDPYVSSIDLRVTDPAFEIQHLGADIARSVTLCLPGSMTEKQRLAAIGRFMGESPAYNRKQVVQAIAAVRTPRELECSVRYRAQFLSGPAITERLAEPVGALAFARVSLPMLRQGRQAA